MEMTNRHAYPLDKLGGDYARASIGLALCLAPVAFLPVMSIGVWLMAGLAALFGLFGLRTLIRQFTRIELDDGGVTVHALGSRSLTWGRLNGLSLSFFSTWHGRGEGWMQLRLKGGGRTLRFESTLIGFAEIVRLAVGHARANGVPLNEATKRNLKALEQAVKDEQAMR